MAPSSTTAQTSQAPDPLLQELTQIHALLDVLIGIQQRQEQQLKTITKVLNDQANLLDGFTSGGSSFRAYQLDPVALAYASILGPVISDRLDGEASKSGQDYLDQMTKGAAVLARRLIRTLDDYRSQREGLDYIETEMQGSTLFPAPGGPSGQQPTA